MSNAPIWGLVFYINPPVFRPIEPRRGVVGHYIDRCIRETASSLCDPEVGANVGRVTGGGGVIGSGSGSPSLIT